LGHSVYPFKGKGERRSLSFNADMISMPELEMIKKMEERGHVETEDDVKQRHLGAVTGRGVVVNEA